MARKPTTSHENSAQGFVYFITPQDPFIRGDAQRVKIGFTTGKPAARLRTLQCGSPIPLRLWAYIEGSEALERAFHEAFAPLRANGEWFFIDYKLFDFLGYFDEVSGQLVSNERVETALFDNIISESPPHPSVPEAQWLASACIKPLLPFYPGLRDEDVA